jgi:kumamolisin
MGKQIACNASIFLLVFLLVLECLVPVMAVSGNDSKPSEIGSEASKVQAAQISSLGELQSGTVDFAVTFNIRNQEQLDSFISQAQSQVNGVQPEVSEEQFEQNYSPTEANYNQVISFLEQHNITVTQTWPNRLMITAQGSVQDVQAVFNTGIGLYSHQGETFYKSSNSVTLPAALASSEVAAVDINSQPVTPHHVRATQIQPNSNQITPNAIAYNKPPTAFRDAYGTTNAIAGGWTGTGVTIGIVDAYGDPTIDSDVSSFNSHYGLPSLSLTTSGTGGTNTGWAQETALDVEWAHAMAPGAVIRLQVTSSNSESSMYGAVNTLVSLTTPPSIISLSWGGDETSSYTYIFSAAVAKGIKVYVSTGDDGAYNGGSSFSVQYPASDPNVIAVGGTTTYVNTVQGVDEYYEYGWSGSGGGYSSIFSEPAFQSNAGIPDASGKRAIPDVCLNADPSSGVTICIGGVLQSGWGGTSLSAPMMAGIAAVALNGSWNLNNNYLYSSYGTDKYGVSFHDVWASGNNGYPVQTGWDQVTGLGSINLNNFVNIYPASAGVSFTGQTLTPSSIIRGQTVQLSYPMTNPSSSSLIQIGMGAAIRLHGTTNQINDTTNDIYVTLPSGSSTQTRNFLTSSSLTSGYYDVAWTTWMGAPYKGSLLSTSNWQNNALLITESTSDFIFTVDASPATRIISAGATTTYDVSATLANGNTQAITLSCTPAITGVTYSFNPSSSSPTFASTLTVQTSSSTPAGSYTLTITGSGVSTASTTAQLVIGDAYEPDNSFTQYSSMTVTSTLQSQSRSIEPVGDNDYIRFYGNPGIYTFYTTGSTDTYGYLYNANHVELAHDDDSHGSLQFQIGYTITSSNYYFLRVRAYSNISTYHGPYTLYYSYLTAPPTPTQISPVNGTALTSSSTTLSWTNSAGAANYRLEITGPSPYNLTTTSTSYTASPLSAGTYTWRVRAYNSSGWSDWTNPWTFYYDTTPPTTPSPDNGVSGWNGVTAQFSWAPSTDTGSGIAGYYWHVDSGSDTFITTTSVSVTGVSEGSHTFYVKAKDNAGNNGSYGSHAFQMDNTYPTGSIVINSNAQFTVQISVTLTLTYSDTPSGVDKVRYSNDGVWDTETWETAAASKAWTLTSGDGTKTVYYQIRDNAGLISQYSDTILLDTVGPTGSITINGGAAYTNTTSVTLTLSVTDISGVAQMRFSNDNSAWSTWETYGASKAWTLLTGDGSKTVYAQFKDNSALASSTLSASITIDTTVPTSNAGGSKTVTQGNSVSFDGSGSSDAAGIVTYLWNFGDGTQGTGASVTHTYANAGSYTLTLTVFDSAGNSAQSTATVTVNAPQATPTPSSGGSNNGGSNSGGSTTTTTPTPRPPIPTPTPTVQPNQTTPQPQTPTATPQPTDNTTTIILVVVVIAIVASIAGAVAFMRRNKLPPPPP